MAEDTINVEGGNVKVFATGNLHTKRNTASNRIIMFAKFSVGEKSFFFKDILEIYHISSGKLRRR
jgi:hypothetical protein